MSEACEKCTQPVRSAMIRGSATSISMYSTQKPIGISQWVAVQWVISRIGHASSSAGPPRSSVVLGASHTAALIRGANVSLSVIDLIVSKS